MSKGLNEEVAPSTLRFCSGQPREGGWECPNRISTPRSQQRLFVHFSVINVELQKHPGRSAAAQHLYITFYFSLRINPQVRPCSYSHFAGEESEALENRSDLRKSPQAVHGRAKIRIQGSCPHSAFLLKTQDERRLQVVKCFPRTQGHGVTTGPPNSGSDPLWSLENLGELGTRLPRLPPGVTLGMSPEEVCDRCRTRTEGVSRGGSRPQQKRPGFRLHRWSQGDGLHQQLSGAIGPSLSGVAVGRRGPCVSNILYKAGYRICRMTMWPLVQNY